MNKIQVFFLLLVSLIFLVSCNTSCEDKKVGDVNLLNSSNSFLPYTDGQKLKFIANDNSKIELSTKIEASQKSRLCVKFICKLFSDPFKNAKCEFFDAETKTVSFTNSNNSFIATLGLHIDLYEGESELFYDLFSASLSTDNVIIEGQLPLEPHFTSPKFDETSLPLSNRINLKNEVILSGQKFESVYELRSNGDYMYFQKGKGLVAFIILGKVFLLN
jgi:hypothetical protein